LRQERELAERKEEQEREQRARLDKALEDEQRSEERRQHVQQRLEADVRQRLEAAQKRLAEILKSTHSISCLYMVKLLERSIFHDVFRRRRSGRRKDGAKP